MESIKKKSIKGFNEMKILHTSDWHLGRLLHGRSLIEDQKHFLNWLINYLTKNDYDVMIIAGDVYDRSIPPSEAVNLLSNFLSDLRKKSSIEIFIIPGNHDSAERLSFCNEILKEENIIIQSDDEAVDVPYVIEKDSRKYAFYGIPFLYDTMGASEDNSLSDYVKKIETTIDKDCVNICIAHAFIAGSKTSESERSYVGGLTQIDSGLFSIFDYTALGHLHKGQKVGENVFYSGSPLKYSFSESVDEKHLLSVDIDEESVSISEIYVPPLYEMTRVSDSFLNLINSSKYLEIKNNYIEAELTDEVLIENPVSVLRNIFPNILSVIQKPDAFITNDEFDIQPDEKRTPIEEFEMFFKYISDEELSMDLKNEFVSVLKEVESETA